MSFVRSLLLCLTAAALASVGHGQVYYPLYAPSTGRTLNAYCRNLVSGEIVPYCWTGISTHYWQGTNAHTHYSVPAPHSSVSPSTVQTGAGGYAPVTLTTTIVGQAEWATTCAVGGGCGNYYYAVGRTIFWVSNHGIWLHTGANEKHGNSVDYNHWMRTDPAYAYYYATLTYQGAHPEHGLVWSNDMSLPFGGKFDLLGTWSLGEDHLSHGEGTAADTNNIPPAQREEFLEYCRMYHVPLDARIETNGSLHCRWAP